VTTELLEARVAFYTLLLGYFLSGSDLSFAAPSKTGAGAPAARKIEIRN
jgi:hypothetical protein